MKAEDKWAIHPDVTSDNGAWLDPCGSPYWNKCVQPHKKDANVWRPYGFWNFHTISDNLMDCVNPSFKQFNAARTKAIHWVSPRESICTHECPLFSSRLFSLAFWTSQWITMKLSLFFLWGTDFRPPFGDFKWFVRLVWGDFFFFLVKECLILLEFFMFRKGLVKRSNQSPHVSFAKRGSFVYEA